ncbi:Uncharacterised protein [Raoultella planticola]|uniref:Uncharacterized protein n=1 Tax=Raoultella planticola TaxID=575 RepID=A0A485DBN5_RAOPL|nr:Uncharacterised protein [Raoultella planticola]
MDEASRAKSHWYCGVRGCKQKYGGFNRLYTYKEFYMSFDLNH